MPHRRGRALYELVRERQGPRPVREVAPGRQNGPPPPPPEEEPTPLSWFSPGRTVRVPVGYFLFGLALVVAVFVAGWAIGHEQAESAWEREKAALYATSGLPSRDPALEQVPVNPSLVDVASPRANQGAGTPSRGEGQASPARQSAPPRSGGGTDPREPGLNYLIVARFGPENAERAAAFLRANGVDAMALPRNNERLVPVIALRGFPGGEVGGAEARAFRQEVQRIGRLWRSETGRNIDFDGSYFEKHQP